MPRQEGTTYISGGASRKSLSLTGIVFQIGGVNVTTATTGADTSLYTYTIPRNLLNCTGPTTNGKGLRVYSWGNKLLSANSATTGIKLGSTSVCSITRTASSSLHVFEVWLFRTDIQKFDAYARQLDSTTGALTYTAVNNADVSVGSAIPLQVYCNQTDANDMQFRGLIVELLTEGMVE